jgi:hypothetical protein
MSLLIPKIGGCLSVAFAAVIGGGCQGAPVSGGGEFSQFAGLEDFSKFTRTDAGHDEALLLSPQIESRIPWNQLIVSWNAHAPAGTYLKIEARAVESDHTTKFYTLGLWSPDDKAFPRASVAGQKDADGDVEVDTLVLNRAAGAAQIRLTLGGSNGVLPDLKFLGLSFCDTNVSPAVLTPNRAAWGKIIPTPERSQQSYAGGGGWCSPTSLSMVLARWADVAHRPDWDFDAPETAAGVFDHHFSKATGNWPFNTAFAGSLNGMRACVSRFSDISELEDWIAAGIPVIISARYDLLQDGRAEDLNGHLTVCRGFTENGDLVINDPWTDVKVESVRHVYKRGNVRRAWATSHNTVYLVYPEKWALPGDRFGHW